MNRKIWILVMACMLSFTCFAEKEVVLNEKDLKGSCPKSEIPRAYYDEESVTLVSTGIIKNVRVVVKDGDGEIVISEYVDITPSGLVFAIPKGFDEDKYTIEIDYAQASLRGTWECKSQLQNVNY